MIQKPIEKINYFLLNAIGHFYKASEAGGARIFRHLPCSGANIFLKYGRRGLHCQSGIDPFL